MTDIFYSLWKIYYSALSSFLCFFLIYGSFGKIRRSQVILQGETINSFWKAPALEIA